MTHENSDVRQIESEEDFALRAREIFQKLHDINPDKVYCTMGIAVTESPNNKDEVVIHAFVLGNDEDISKMFSSLATVTRNGIMQANTHTNEVKH